jgi:hypothetical protein
MKCGNLAVYACVASRQFYVPALGTINNTAANTVIYGFLVRHLHCMKTWQCIHVCNVYGLGTILWGGGGRGRILGRHWDKEFSS